MLREVPVFSISSVNLDVLREESIHADCAEIRAILSAADPAMAQMPRLSERIREILCWAADRKIAGKPDVTILAELVIRQRLNVLEDPDLCRLLDTGTPPHRDIMLHYLAEKPPDFWAA